jgi:hypothetical protein
VDTPNHLKELLKMSMVPSVPQVRVNTYTMNLIGLTQIEQPPVFHFLLSVIEIQGEYT